MPGFGLRVYPSGKRSYLIQYRAKGRSRRYEIGIHGVWTPETARREAKTVLGQIAQGQDPATEREEERRAVTVQGLFQEHIADMEATLVLGKGGRPKKATTVATDSGRIRGHIIPLLGTRRMKDIIVGKTSDIVLAP
ncbi:Arm DNA-binding domain-containing protein [uncultured Roseobacter sp.]|uniref:Arm DNA-binding domain-containing protein n=1 Tax=uncultured Roseobacter sp. TaxID=114847 RepID=UPI00262BE61B|nr:Arm DNA-binding domain-containing protein [uncultured Roseobacter sp.]